MLSPFYDALLIRYVSVCVDGQPVQDAIEAYEEMGMVRIFERDAGGNLVLDRKRRCLRETQVYGKVEIRLKEGAPELVRQHFARKREER
jgi:hypothetical protein